MGRWRRIGRPSWDKVLYARSSRVSMDFCRGGVASTDGNALAAGRVGHIKEIDVRCGHVELNPAALRAQDTHVAV